MILATRTNEHCRSNEGNDLIDLDLSGLGDAPEKYDETTAKVRAEYSRYNDEQWALGRRKFLVGFLARPRIFHTDTLAHLEWQARNNMTRELATYEL